MENNSRLLIDLSALYRNMQKYFDTTLEPLGIGSGQLMVLILVNENNGISPAQITELTGLDKGTSSKALKQLAEAGFINIIQDSDDRRIKRAYTTEKSSVLMRQVYDLRNSFCSEVGKEADLDQLALLLHKANTGAQKAVQMREEESSPRIKIGGMQKFTLLDYPGVAACTIFTAGCNLKCPFCHNKDLVFLPENFEYFDEDKIFAYLEKRRGILDGVCISGGEPLMQKGLLSFIHRIKDLGYKVKLDTNGNEPERLQEVLESSQIDYVAMDIKNSPEKYAQTTGMSENSQVIDRVRKSVDLLMNGTVDYEFRTTVVREFHTLADMEEIGSWIQGAKRYYLQQFVDSGNVIKADLHAHTKAEMTEMQQVLEKYVPTYLRGVKED